MGEAMDQNIQMLVTALVTVASQYVGYLALSKKIEMQQEKLTQVAFRISTLEKVHDHP